MKLSQIDFSKIQIWKYPYTLKRILQANSQTAEKYQIGALIKIQDEFGNFGYADLCPWPSLGDLTLDEEFNQRGPLFRRSIQLAYDDLIARKNKICLASKHHVYNNILINNYRPWIQENKNELLKFNGQSLKIKCDRDEIALAQQLNELFLDQLNLDIKLRLDFNFCLTYEKFKNFIKIINPDILKKIEYVEDPFPFDLNQWTDINHIVPLALDWNLNNNQWSFRIIKPSREELNAEQIAMNFTLTSAMDHPVGVVHGLRWAQQFPEKTHGFATLDQYEPSDFNYFFQLNDGVLTYHSDGFGIGFTQILSRLNWIPLVDLKVIENNFLLCGHRLSSDEIAELFLIKNKVCIQFQLHDCILIPSSGSTQKENESTKVIVLKRQAIIESAKRVNLAFNVTQQSCWGCVLPLFHVGGLGVVMRSLVAGCRYAQTEWSDFSVQWLEENQITHLSLVPTQLFEIVQANMQAPNFLKHVLIGGASLHEDLAEAAIALGWPIVQTFGMTETASMIAIKRDIHSVFFETLGEVRIQNQNNKLSIASLSNALMSVKLDRFSGDLRVEQYKDWLVTQDEVEIQDNKFKFLQRESDFVKIKGEGVSLFELRHKLSQILIKQNISYIDFTIVDFTDVKDGSVLYFVIADKIHLTSDKIHGISAEFNLKVRPYEKINSYIILDVIPKTDLNKIKFNEIKKQRNLNVKKI